jgi:hypothetical protein
MQTCTHYLSNSWLSQLQFSPFTIKTTVWILTPLSHATYLTNLVCQKALMSCFTSLTFFQTLFPPAEAIQVALAVLLDVRAILLFICRNHCKIQVNQATNGVISSSDVLADLLESIERFINRLQQYIQLPPTPSMDEVLIKLNIELISTLARATGKLNNRHCQHDSVCKPENHE